MKKQKEKPKKQKTKQNKKQLKQTIKKQIVFTKKTAKTIYIINTVTKVNIILFKQWSFL